MATLNDIDLTINTHIANETEGSAIDRSVKNTQDGRLVVFQKHKPKYRSLVYHCTWLPWSTVKRLIALRDSGAAAILTHNDGRTFNVLIESIDGDPVIPLNLVKDNHHFQITLNLLEI